MVAIEGKADKICSIRALPVLNPNRTIGEPLFDYLVGAAKQRERDGDADRLGGPEIDKQLDLHHPIRKRRYHLRQGPSAKPAEPTPPLQLLDRLVDLFLEELRRGQGKHLAICLQRLLASARRGERAAKLGIAKG
jgi:hypothetical protein